MHSFIVLLFMYGFIIVYTFKWASERRIAEAKLQHSLLNQMRNEGNNNRIG